ncbi:MAG TPA: HDIG domain-containing protein [Nitrososphaeria archaeon]|nr:HDIG domain-containing protein [Nitrososphaeria archaeon]
MDKDEALRLVEENVSDRRIVLHMIAVSAIMRALARYLGEDEEEWGLVGLLHDIDYERTKADPARHGLEAENILKGRVSEEVLRAIKAHNFENTGVKPETRLENALIAADAVSGLIVASALVMPHKRLEEVRVETLEKKFRQKDFARRVSRERIMFCEKLGLSREKFFELALEALKGISGELGL